jgi:hypothetical protein
MAMRDVGLISSSLHDRAELKIRARDDCDATLDPSDAGSRLKSLPDL